MALPSAFGGSDAAGAARVNGSAVVLTDKGLVQGAVTETNRTFLGVPYAAPPVGELRWRAPAAAAPWTGVLAAMTPGNKCAQVEELAGNTLEGSEDCLNLNVYEPAAVSPGGLPVMVFIPGGGYVFGSNTDIDPRALAQKQNMIVVTINYRLGALGYLATPALGAENAASSGNFGLLDQQAALRWVQANINRFGGDASRTTIAGESAGGAGVLAQVVSPTAAGLFQRAIVESGAGVGFTTQAAAQAQGARFAADVGCTDPAEQLTCLRATDVTTVLTKELLGAPPLLLPAAMAWSPTVGGPVLPASPAAAFSGGTYNKVPILQGTNHDEWRLFAAGAVRRGQPALTVDSYAGLMRQLFGARAAEVLAVYPSRNYSSPTAAYAAVATDVGFVCPARTVDRAVAGTVPLYAYEFNDPNAPAPFVLPDFPLGAYHTAELLYVFPRTGDARFTSEQVDLSDRMTRLWGNFVAHGSPNPSEPTWTPYTQTRDAFLSLAPSSTKMINTFSADHHCSFWATAGV
ncbi:carboxylesterase/lipase family protein [Streptomyces sp. DSM 41987]|uniref:carboxylesterase/lipase family protein n=1 Tax=Streptomyces TaxID=1883 RepID=UPI0036238FB8